MSIILNKHKQLYSGLKIFIFTFFYFLILATVSSLQLPFNYYLDLAVVRGSMVIFCIVAYTVVYILEKRSPKQFGIIFRLSTMKHLLLGLLVGILSIFFIALFLFATNQAKLTYSWNQPVLSLDILYIFLLFIAVGIDEELLTRGYMVHTLGRYNKPFMVYLVPAIIFGALHLSNPSIHIIGFINITLIGVAFTYMTLKTGNIMMAIGFHITWNFFQGGFFGFNVSGATTASIYPVEIMGNDLFTGGDFGLEGGLFATLTIVILTIVIYFLPLKKVDNSLLSTHKQNSTGYKKAM